MTKKVLISLDDLKMLIPENTNDSFYNDCTGFDSRGDVLRSCVNRIFNNIEDWFDSQPAARQWVSVEDDKPKKGDVVAIRVDGQDYFWLRGHYSNGVWLDEWGYIIDFVTHWIPIPPLPEED